MAERHEREDFTVRQLRDLSEPLIAIVEKALAPRFDDVTSSVREAIKQHQEVIEKRVDSVESHLTRQDKRIGNLENFKWWVLGVGAAVGAVAGVVMEWIRVKLVGK